MGAFSALDLDRTEEAAFQEGLTVAFTEEPPAFTMDGGLPQTANEVPPAQQEVGGSPTGEEGKALSEDPNDNPTGDTAASSAETAGGPEAPAAEAQTGEADDEAARKAHEAAEAKRKAEWEAKRRAKKEREEAALRELQAMSDQEVMKASMKRVGADTEKLTRRNMKECVSEYIQTMCLEDMAFARKVMHPRKSMLHCFWYINRKAREFVEKEMKDNDIKPEAVNGVYGSDVPDDLCYQWAVDYYNDPDAREDQEKEEKFVPKPYYGRGAKNKSAAKKTSNSKKEVKKAEQKPAPKKPATEIPSDQITLGDLGMFGQKAG